MKFLALALMATMIASCQQSPNRSRTLVPTPKQDGAPNPPKTIDNPPVRVNPVAPLKVSVMAYNLENLFDDVKDHDEKPADKNVLDKKLSQVAKGILQIENKGPDILIVEEVENLNVLKMLRDKFLKAAGYQTVVLLESNDERGIDVGIFSRFPLASEPKLHKMPFSDINPTRGIMEATLTLANKKTIRVFGVHFPSQANDPQQREQAAVFLKDLMRHSDTDYVVAGGDFNITPVEETKLKVFSDILKEFKISHIEGCKTCKGTYHYKYIDKNGDKTKDKDTWSFYDVLLTRENTLVADSVSIPNKADGQLAEDKESPKRFDSTTGKGISDHLPIFAELSL